MALASLTDAFTEAFTSLSENDIGLAGSLPEVKKEDLTLTETCSFDD